MSASPVVLDKSTLTPVNQSGAVTLDKSTLRPAIATAPSSNSDLSSALDSLARMNTGQKMATAEQEKEFQAGKASGQVAGTTNAVLGGVGGVVSAALSPGAAATTSVGTGILDATGAEIMKDITTFGPSVARTVLSHPLAQKILLHAAGLAGGGAILKALGVFGEGK